MSNKGGWGGRVIKSERWKKHKSGVYSRMKGDRTGGGGSGIWGSGGRGGPKSLEKKGNRTKSRKNYPPLDEKND